MIHQITGHKRSVEQVQQFQLRWPMPPIRIIYYVRSGNKRGLVEALNSRRGKIDFIDVGGQTLLHSAATMTVPLEITEELIWRGIDLNRPDFEGRTAIHYATIWKRRDVVEAILEAGGRLDIPDEHGNQPLWYAIQDLHRDEALIALLMHFGANPHHRNNYGKSPIDIARIRGAHSVLQILDEKC